MPPTPQPKNVNLENELNAALEKVKGGNNLTLAEIDELQDSLTEFRIEIFKNDVKNTEISEVFDDEYFDSEFNDLEICEVDGGTCF